MKSGILVLVAACAALMAQGPEFTPDGKLMRPANYREWIYLSSGLGMTYGGRSTSEPAFDNVFVSPSAYREFLATGRWPEKTMFVLEIRNSESHGSINKDGFFQAALGAVEMAVKDEARFIGNWGYFDFPVAQEKIKGTSKHFPPNASCYGCHSTNGAVENTFVQFYPTLIPVAEKKKTLRGTMTANGFQHAIAKAE